MDNETRDEIRNEGEIRYKVMLERMDAIGANLRTDMERNSKQLMIVMLGAVGLGVAFLSFFIRLPY